MRETRSVLFLTYHFPPEVGGIQTRLDHYLYWMREKGVKATVFFAVSRPRNLGTYTLHGAEVVVSLGKTQHLLQNAKKLRSLMVSQRADAIHVFTGVSTILSVYGLLLARAMRVPSVISMFGKEELEFLTLRQKILFNVSVRLATTIAVNSSYMRTQIPTRFQAKTRVILGGAEDLPDQHPPADDNTMTVLFVGRLVKSKGIDDLLLAYKIVKDSVPDAKLTIVGDGPERGRLERMAQELKLSQPDILFRGTLRGEALHEAYDTSTVVVLPSKRVPDDPAVETFGLSLVEALMHAKPVVGTALGGIPEIIENGVNGFLVSEGKPEELANALKRLLLDEEIRHSMSSRALEIAMSKFSWSAATDRLLACYVN